MKHKLSEHSESRLAYFKVILDGMACDAEITLGRYKSLEDYEVQVREFLNNSTTDWIFDDLVSSEDYEELLRVTNGLKNSCLLRIHNAFHKEGDNA